MKILIKTQVQQHYKKVWKGFNQELFEALKPPLLPLELRRFDGSETGDEVHIRLGKGFLTQDWNAVIIEHGSDEKECYFIDEGSKLPFFLKNWKHRHRILKESENTSIIIDDISYQTPFWLLDYLMYPVMYLQFWARKPVYKKVFSDK